MQEVMNVRYLHLHPNKFFIQLKSEVKYVKKRNSVIFYPEVMPILSTVPEKSLTVKEGEDVSFNCSLTKGNPKPRLLWRRKHKEFISGKKIKPKSYTFDMKI